ncbi:unnamed protein product [Cuscuta campestris]|uniref:Uncharacterized protein n=1 Tax=Cuscuta campestris TaxID=132261 RepID=A0A484NFF8_9ASTE|nr:unnamed protein product [Cuscuta campestris]
MHLILEDLFSITRSSCIDANKPKKKHWSTAAAGIPGTETAATAVTPLSVADVAWLIENLICFNSSNNRGNRNDE